MTSTAALVAVVLLAAPDGAVRCGDFDARNLARVERSENWPNQAFLHPSGTLATLRHPEGEFSIRGWIQPLDVRERRLPIASLVNEMLPDGRLVLKRFEDRKAVYRVVKWDGLEGVSDVVTEVREPRDLAAIACGLQPKQVGALAEASSVVCVGRRLVGARAIGTTNQVQLFAWDGKSWQPTKATVAAVDLGSRAAMPMLLLSDPASPSTRDALERFGIVFSILPEDSRVVACGSDACWALGEDGRLHVQDNASPGSWKKIGQLHGFAIDAEIIAGGSRAVLLAPSCRPEVYYLRLDER